MPQPWEALLQFAAPAQPWERLAGQVGAWRDQVQPAIHPRPPVVGRGLPDASGTSSASVRQQFTTDLKRCSGLNRNRQGSRWDKISAMDGWRQGMEERFARQGLRLLENGKAREQQKAAARMERLAAEERREGEGRKQGAAVFQA